MNTTPPYTKWFNGFDPIPRAEIEPIEIKKGQILVPKVEKSHGQGQPSDPIKKDYPETFYVPYAKGEDDKPVSVLAKLEVKYTVEDWGYVKLGKKRIIGLMESDGGSNEPTYRGHLEWSGEKEEEVNSGSHTLEFHYENINMPRELNRSVCKYSYEVRAIEDGGKKEPTPCDCAGNTCSLEGGPDASQTRSVVSLLPGGETSSAASSVTYEATEDSMLWSCNIGNLRGLGAVLSGKVQIYTDTFGPQLATPAALTFKHPMNATMLIPEGGAVPGALLELHMGSRIIALRYYLDGSIAPIGVDSAGRGRVTPSFAEDETLSSLKWQDESGASWVFDCTSGALISYTSPEKVTISDVDDLLQVKLNAAGSQLRQVWSYWDGLLNIENITETGYRIALYTPNQVAGPGEDGYYTLIDGATPFKAFTFSYAATGLTVVESTPDLDDYTCTWSRETGGAWSTVIGTGNEAITTARVRTVVEQPSLNNPYEVWQLVTTVSKGGVTAARTCDVYQKSPMGNLLLTHVDGYDSPEAQATTYEYDAVGNVITEVAPNGHRVTSVYDSTGRLIRTTEPWGGNEYTQITEYEYAYDSADRYSAEPAYTSKTLHKLADNSMVILSEEYYTRTEENGILREERHRSAAGSDLVQLEVTETWTGDAPDALNKGRVRMTQAVNGVQTLYAYAKTSQYGAIYTITKETQVNGEAVRGHSTRSIEYINAAGNTVRAEEWVLLYTNEWVKISGVNYTYDVQNRRIGSVKDNHRSSTRTLTCRNQPLREVDENGIRTDYAYDSARQLIEVTRAAVMDGDTVVTPETITEYTRDAVGRVLMTKVHTGAMLAQASGTYDLVGRITSETDVLGRVTNHAYSSDGLTTTVTRPNGATLITTLYTDGRLHRESGTGQPYRFYKYDVANHCQRTQTYLDEGETAMSERYINGFGQEIISARAVPNGLVSTRNSYNAEGQLIRTQQDDGTAAHAMVPTLYSYDQFGNVVQETLALADEPDVTNSRCTFYVYSKQQREDGIYSMVTTGRNNSAGVGYTSSTARLISELNATLESKSIVTDSRGKDSTSWTERGTGAIRTQKQQIPTSNITATARVVDGFVVSQTDTAGISTTQTRGYLSSGTMLTQTDGRGNTTVTRTDIAGRIFSVTDATGANTFTSFDEHTDNPAIITNAQGKTTCYRYDLRGRKVAEWGTAVQPACFGYDDADRLVSLTTFRVDAGDITSDPTERTDGDTTRWSYDPASGLELCKTYADNSTFAKTYDSFGRLATETNARGTVKTFSYLSTTGELSGIVFADNAAPSQAFTYTLTGKLAGVTDAAGMRSFTYNEYDELVTDSLTVGNETHLITENRDEVGRSTGFAYSEADGAFGSEQYGYGTDGRLATAAFSHNGEWKSFGYGYLPGTNQLQTLTMPNGMTLTQQFEEKRDLLTGMLYKRGTTGVVERYYTYDSLGRPLTRSESRNGSTRNDAFAHNDRSELSEATLGSDSYAYAYDNIGNRKTAQENAEEATAYTANALNQYTAVGSFVPTYDADGNQTKVQTSTGIWNVAYNAENRPTVFSRTNEDGTSTQITCAYDYMGRRATKKVETITTNAETGESTASTTLNQRYLYRGYLQVACCDLTRSAHPCLWFITWDPTQPVATRPLAIRKDGTWYCYGWDLTKNVCEVFSNEGYISNTVIYSYTPYGAVTAEGTVTQPLRWSSEFYDDELGLTYYNYRHYNPGDGRWGGRDIVKEDTAYNVYVYLNGCVMFKIDIQGADEYRPYLSGGTQCSSLPSPTSNNGIEALRNALASKAQILSKYNCTFIISRATEKAIGKFDTQAVENQVRSILESHFAKGCLTIKNTKEHQAGALSDSLKSTKCVCGIIYIGHASIEPSRLIFDESASSLATRNADSGKQRHPLSSLPTQNILPNSVSAIYGCRSAASDSNGGVSVAQALSQHFQGTAIGSVNKLNFDGGDPYTPFWSQKDFGKTTHFVTFTTKSQVKPDLEKKCCCSKK